MKKITTPVHYIWLYYDPKIQADGITILREIQLTSVGNSVWQQEISVDIFVILHSRKYTVPYFLKRYFLNSGYSLSHNLGDIFNNRGGYRSNTFKTVEDIDKITLETIFRLMESFHIICQRCRGLFGFVKLYNSHVVTKLHQRDISQGRSGEKIDPNYSLCNSITPTQLNFCWTVCTASVL